MLVVYILLPAVVNCAIKIADLETDKDKARENFCRDQHIHTFFFSGKEFRAVRVLPFHLFGSIINASLIYQFKFNEKNSEFEEFKQFVQYEDYWYHCKYPFLVVRKCCLDGIPKIRLYFFWIR